MGNRKAQAGGMVLRISSDGDDRMMGAKNKTQENPKKSLNQKLTPKKSNAEFPSLKNFHKALNDIMFTKNQNNRY